MTPTPPDKAPAVVNKAFIAACAVMILGVVAIQGYTLINGLKLVKAPAPPRRGLYLMPDTMGPYTKASDLYMPHAMIDEMGTKRFIGWLVAGPDRSGLVYRVNVAYYTGLPDARPHVPTRCYTAGGVSPQNPTGAEAELDASGFTTLEDGRLRRDVAGMGDVTLPSRIPVTVADVTPANQRTSQKLVSFYIANGRYLPDAQAVLEVVTDPSPPRIYWCKVEVMPMRVDSGVSRGVTDSAQALEAVTAYLGSLLPEVVACLPEF
ncbi:MAG: hypothetical protein ACYTGQ_03200 [Planctomycetota bacterium]|jgi:hypothetical protein